MRGYWNAPEATAAVISIDERGRWLHTGDAGHLDADGYLYLEGRLSDIIKAWGHRVSPAEVEEVALLMPGIAEAAAVGVPDGLVGDAIHLYVVREAGCTLTEVDILAHCRLHLSFYKLPRRVFFAGALPRTANGKTQRHLLADLAEAAS
jgi:acyl-CoA synthetase (AMP-forming)/AMP-acid ligase II